MISTYIGSIIMDVALVLINVMCFLNPYSVKWLRVVNLIAAVFVGLVALWQCYRLVIYVVDQSNSPI